MLLHFVLTLNFRICHKSEFKLPVPFRANFQGSITFSKITLNYYAHLSHSTCIDRVPEAEKGNQKGILTLRLVGVAPACQTEMIISGGSFLPLSVHISQVSTKEILWGGRARQAGWVGRLEWGEVMELERVCGWEKKTACTKARWAVFL